ncbi:MAG: ATP-dependent RecD-like DNA helicase [Lentisphaeria bacterium]|nr:ATP-dependent RecD-like DNA helicase [Lentisphaeria bacterium]
MAQAEEKVNFRLAGEVRRILYENSENGFAVITLKTPEGNRVRACGSLAGIQTGQTVELFGKFESHPDFGEEFKAESLCVKPPVTEEGIKRFLASSVPGIGSRTAAKIVEHFGKDTLHILQNYPRRLCEIPRIGAKKAEEISRIWKESAGKRESLMFLQGLGITPAYCSRLLAAYGSNAAEIVRKNPYRLAEDVSGVGFLKADAVARELGFAEDSTERLTAAAVFSLNNMISSGHVCVERGELELRTAALTNRSQAEAARGVEAALVRRLLKYDMGMIYSPRLLQAESRLAEKIVRLSGAERFCGREICGEQISRQISAEQLAAVNAVRFSPLSIITGGPGVGKTTVVGELVARAQNARLKLMLAAPTGRAAKRLSETTGCQAKTIHRLLMYDPGTNRFACDSSNFLDCDLLIVDECSMLDVVIAQALFDAVEPGTSVVLVGDSDQLPSVGPGRVLADFIASGLFAVTHLTQVFRQQSGSLIIANAHRVNSGRMPELPQGNGTADFYWIEQEDPQKAADMICRMAAERIPARFGLDAVEDVQVLAPMNRGLCGTEMLNQLLGERLNPAPSGTLRVGEKIFRMNDKVMQISNNYDKSVFNGDFGRVVWIDGEKHRLKVSFDGERIVEYTPDELEQLTPAYAVTIHKSQGSEFPAVIVPLLNQHYMMLQRNLLYTAMTRARKLLVLIGSGKALQMAVRNMRQEQRWSLLQERIRTLVAGQNEHKI